MRVYMPYNICLMLCVCVEVGGVSVLVFLPMVLGRFMFAWGGIDYGDCR